MGFNDNDEFVSTWKYKDDILDVAFSLDNEVVDVDLIDEGVDDDPMDSCNLDNGWTFVAFCNLDDDVLVACCVFWEDMFVVDCSLAEDASKGWRLKLEADVIILCLIGWAVLFDVTLFDFRVNEVSSADFEDDSLLVKDVSTEVFIESCPHIVGISTWLFGNPTFWHISKFEFSELLNSGFTVFACVGCCVATVVYKYGVKLVGDKNLEGTMPYVPCIAVLGVEEIKFCKYNSFLPWMFVSFCKDLWWDLLRLFWVWLWGWTLCSFFHFLYLKRTCVSCL